MSTDASLPITTASGRTAVWRHIFAGFCASLVSIGLARFAYTPLIPPLIQAHWFAASDVVYLGAANLAGYLLGALLGRPVAHRLTNTHTLRAMMVLVTATFLACAFPVSVAWFFFWRLLSGVAGGAIMVLVAATVLPHVPADRKGLASGAIFLGLGVGIAASGTIVPLLLNLGLRNTWIGIAILSATAIVISVSSVVRPRGCPIISRTSPCSRAIRAALQPFTGRPRASPTATPRSEPRNASRSHSRGARPFSCGYRRQAGAACAVGDAAGRGRNHPLR